MIRFIQRLISRLLWEQEARAQEISRLRQHQSDEDILDFLLEEGAYRQSA